MIVCMYYRNRGKYTWRWVLSGFHPPPCSPATGAPAAHHASTAINTWILVCVYAMAWTWGVFKRTEGRNCVPQFALCLLQTTGLLFRSISLFLFANLSFPTMRLDKTIKRHKKSSKKKKKNQNYFTNKIANKYNTMRTKNEMTQKNKKI